MTLGWVSDTVFSQITHWLVLFILCVVALAMKEGTNLVPAIKQLLRYTRDT